MSFVKVKEPKDDHERMKIRIIKPKPKAPPAGLISKPYKQLLKYYEKEKREESKTRETNGENNRSDGVVLHGTGCQQTTKENYTIS